jgi:hypothetical protein
MLRRVSHSSGITMRGRGEHSRKTPEELATVGDETSLDDAKLAHECPPAAQIEGACVQNGFDLYLHDTCFEREGPPFVTEERAESRRDRSGHGQAHAHAAESHLQSGFGGAPAGSQTGQEMISQPHFPPMSTHGPGPATVLPSGQR